MFSKSKTLQTGLIELFPRTVSPQKMRHSPPVRLIDRFDGNHATGETYQYRLLLASKGREGNERRKASTSAIAGLEVGCVMLLDSVSTYSTVGVAYALQVNHITGQTYQYRFLLL